MSGWYVMQRGWQENDLFARDEYSRRDAWVWLIEHAAWRPASVTIKGKRVDLERGQLSYSQRFLADKWGWSKSRVDRFIAELVRRGMLESTHRSGAGCGAQTEAATSQTAGQSQSVLTVCNYSQYQDISEGARGSVEPESGAGCGAQTGPKKNNITNNNSSEAKASSEDRGRAKPAKNQKPKFEIPDWVPAEQWNAFVEMRKAIGKPLKTQRAIKLAVGKLDRLGQQGHDPSEVLDQSTMNSWLGLFPVKGDRLQPPGWRRPTDRTEPPARTGGAAQLLERMMAQQKPDQRGDDDEQDDGGEQMLLEAQTTEIWQ